jgi:hypothetical protein
MHADEPAIKLFVCLFARFEMSSNPSLLSMMMTELTAPSYSPLPNLTDWPNNINTPTLISTQQPSFS